MAGPLASNQEMRVRFPPTALLTGREWRGCDLRSLRGHCEPHSDVPDLRVVAQLGSAPVWGTGGRRFKSGLLDSTGTSPGVGRLLREQELPGSTPGYPTVIATTAMRIVPRRHCGRHQSCTVHNREVVAMPTVISDKLISWASDVDDQTIRQAQMASRLSIVPGHVALMPDAHVGKGATVGSVIPTQSAIIPAAVGVDLGCGMIASRLTASASDLPDNIGALLPEVEKAVPAGVGRGHDSQTLSSAQWLAAHKPPHTMTQKQSATAAAQFGTLGSGNHFFEVCLDEADAVWVVLHSGSRGIGNQLAQAHIAQARSLAKALALGLEDLDLAWFTQGTAEFEAYIADMLWAQEYAMASRLEMAHAATAVLLAALPPRTRVAETINCHHNFATQEVHGGTQLWVTRKGAIKAAVGDRGVIPGSMGTASYIVTGLGNQLSWQSCSHGAGRRMSRAQARKTFTADDLAKAMVGKAWLSDRAGHLIDEIPASYKDIDQVMADQADLVRIDHTLHQVLNYKGT